MPDISNVWAVFASRGSILVKKEKKKPNGFRSYRNSGLTFTDSTHGEIHLNRMKSNDTHKHTKQSHKTRRGCDPYSEEQVTRVNADSVHDIGKLFVKTWKIHFLHRI